MIEDTVSRINELYHKSKTPEGLTPEETVEQTALRSEYIAAVRRNLRGQLNNIDIRREDGSIENLGEKYGTEKRNTPEA